MDSLINVSLNFQVFNGALICIKCDVKIFNCTLVFIATGNQVSGILIYANTQICIQQTFIQYRISSQQSSGIVNSVNTSDVNISIIDCKLIGFNFISSEYSGYIAAQILQNTTISITQLYVCAENISAFGNKSIITAYNGTIDHKCDLCDANYYVYGICSDALKYGQEINHILQCVYPFEYINNQCVCSQGYVLDQYICVNIIQIVNNALHQSNNSELVENISKLENKINQIDQNLSQNISRLYNQISIQDTLVQSKLTELQQNILSNSSTLEHRIIENVSNLENNIRANSSALENFILQNATVLDLRIYNNISALKTNISSIEDNFSVLNKSVADLSFNVSQNISQLYNQISIQDTLVQSKLTELQQNILSNSSTLEHRIIENVSNLENNIRANSSALENFILQNATVLDLRIYNNVSALNQSVADFRLNVSQIITDIQVQYQQQISNLMNQINCTNQAGYQYINGECIRTSCQITGQERVNGICQCADANEIVVNGQCTCNVINGFTMVAGKCSCSSGLSDINGICQLKINRPDGTFQCSQSVYVSTFDINTLTHTADNHNFTVGYVFSNQIQDAFIDIADNAYTTITPIFQSQSSFTNLKIQFGVLSVSGGGSIIISTSSSIVINQMNILSKPNKQITLGASQLNILSSSSSDANINNLLVNLSFASSSGNITLVNNINGVFNISGYQVMGDYTSTLVVAMIGINVQTAAINVNKVSFKPNVYNVGNGSSYLFSSSISTVSTFVINNFAVIIGDRSKFVLFGSIASSLFNYYQFGGIIALISSASPVSVNNVIIDSYQKFNTNQVSKSGFLIGYVQSSSSIINIMNVCLQQNMTSTTQFNNFGLIGENSGNSSFQNASVTFSVQGTSIDTFGIIGCQNSNSLYAEVIDIRISMSVSGSGRDKSIVFGIQDAKNCYIRNTGVEGNISSQQHCIGGIIGFQFKTSNVTLIICSVSSVNISGIVAVGGIIGYTKSEESNTTFQNCSVSNTNISGLTYIGSFIGNQYSNTTIMNSSTFNIIVIGTDKMIGGFIGQSNVNITIINSLASYMNISGDQYTGGIIGSSSLFTLISTKIQYLRIVSQQKFGVVRGDYAGHQSFTNSTAISNFINGVQQAECTVLKTTEWSISGC
ncbi:IPT/TIG_domain-containing protein [Hexamita inflata]|uniref:IPT/TIG_domain-containing protein n=1 Tax=Hexamita inflata TaxID=28002 RepID=A0ABP1GXF8_9EUKA